MRVCYIKSYNKHYEKISLLKPNKKATRTEREKTFRIK